MNLTEATSDAKIKANLSKKEQTVFRLTGKGIGCYDYTPSNLWLKRQRRGDVTFVRTVTPDPDGKIKRK